MKVPCLRPEPEFSARADGCLNSVCRSFERALLTVIDRRRLDEWSDGIA